MRSPGSVVDFHRVTWRLRIECKVGRIVHPLIISKKIIGVAFLNYGRMPVVYSTSDFFHVSFFFYLGCLPKADTALASKASFCHLCLIYNIESFFMKLCRVLFSFSFITSFFELCDCLWFLAKLQIPGVFSKPISFIV